ncbi:MAG: glycosyltransferase family 4 protein [Steroidobacteraceae bacterium]
MNARALEFLVPGDLQSATGGYVYDRTIAAGLRALGWRVGVHGLEGSFPHPNADALAHAARVLADLPDETCVLVDGLALGALPQELEAHARRLPLVALIHMPLAFEFGIESTVAERLRRQEQRALQLVRHVIVTSRATERDLAAYGVDRSRLTVVEPGVWKAAITSGPGAAVHGCVIELLCVATVHEGKGHELLIEALARLTHLPWRLQCVGSLSRSPATVQRLAERVARFGLADRVALRGELPHEALSELYLAADLFVLPTLRESYCLAVAESIAHGLPVISSRTGAIAELVGAGAGLLIEPGDRDALHTALERALTDGALRTSMRTAAREAGARLASWPQACERMARVLERVCGQSACGTTGAHERAGARERAAR